MDNGLVYTINYTKYILIYNFINENKPLIELYNRILIHVGLNPNYYNTLDLVDLVTNTLITNLYSRHESWKDEKVITLLKINRVSL